MALMNEFFREIETHTSLEDSIIRTTKIDEVLRDILKLDSIPCEKKYKFKKRCRNLLESWSKGDCDFTASGSNA
jgi:hypothetical protein